MEAVSGDIFWRYSEFRRHVDSGSGEAKSPPCWSEEDWCVFHRPPKQDSRVVSGKSLCRKWLPCASDGRYPYHAKARWTSLDAKNPAARTPEGFQDRVGDVLEQTSNPCHSPETPECTAGGPCWPSGGAGCSCSSMTDHAGPPSKSHLFFHIPILLPAAWCMHGRASSPYPCTNCSFATTSRKRRP